MTYRMVRSAAFSALMGLSSIWASDAGALSIFVDNGAVGTDNLFWANFVYTTSFTDTRPAGPSSETDDCGFDGSDWKVICSITVSGTPGFATDVASISGSFIHKSIPHPEDSEGPDNTFTFSMLSAAANEAASDPNNVVLRSLFSVADTHDAGSHKDFFRARIFIDAAGPTFNGAYSFEKIQIQFRGTHPVPIGATFPLLLTAAVALGIGGKLINKSPSAAAFRA